MGPEQMLPSETTARSCFAVFHLNLAFSAVSEADRLKVIRQCYLPLLEVISQQGVPVGVECSGWTLREITRWVPGWIKSFKLLLAQGACSLIGSGYVQLIGPLVPERVNRWNQVLGKKAYRELIGVEPTLALVNEMAFAASQVDLYAELGYEGLILERENVVPYLKGTLPKQGPWRAAGLKTSLPVLFSDSILFQKFQRLVQGDIEAHEYWPYVTQWQGIQQATPLYCSDAEIFGYRPRRYHYEATLGLEKEWVLVGELLAQAKQCFRFVRPEDALVRGAGEALALTSAAYPVVVKKQPKYNVARWAVSGRDDLVLNTSCYALEKGLSEPVSEQQQEQVCRLFSSDLRTHIEPGRWAEAWRALGEAKVKVSATPRAPLENTLPPGVSTSVSGCYLTVASAKVRVVLNLRRGLAIKELQFGGDVPLLGTLAHGYFEQIALGADFYSGTTVVEVPGQLLRATDLVRCEPEIGYAEGLVWVRAPLSTPMGIIEKEVGLDPVAGRVVLGCRFPDWTRPFGTVRVGHLTLLPESWKTPLFLRCHHGGPEPEQFEINEPCAHGHPISNLISCTTGFGATTGVIELGDGQRTLRLSWDPSQCAAFPMLLHEPCPPSHLTRVIFSLAEMDDTRKEGGSLLPFRVWLEQTASPNNPS